MAKIYGEENVVRGWQFVDQHGCVDRLTPELAIECKHGARINILAALEQCEADAARKRLNVGRYCVVYVKYDRREPIVALRADDFEDLVRTRRELQSR